MCVGNQFPYVNSMKKKIKISDQIKQKPVGGIGKIPSYSNILPESFIDDFESLVCNTVKHVEAEVIVIPQDRIIRGVFNVNVCS